MSPNKKATNILINLQSFKSLSTSDWPINWTDYPVFWDSQHQMMPAFTGLMNKKCLQSHLQAAWSLWLLCNKLSAPPCVFWEGVLTVVSCPVLNLKYCAVNICPNFLSQNLIFLNYNACLQSYWEWQQIWSKTVSGWHYKYFILQCIALFIWMVSLLSYSTQLSLKYQQHSKMYSVIITSN